MLNSEFPNRAIARWFLEHEIIENTATGKKS